MSGNARDSHHEPARLAIEMNGTAPTYVIMSGLGDSHERDSTCLRNHESARFVIQLNGTVPVEGND
jgi:hypothetical protein